MSAREEELANMTRQSHVVRELKSAGYRILTPDELDPVTLEAAAEVAEARAAIADGFDQKQYNCYTQVAAAIRSLRRTKQWRRRC